MHKWTCHETKSNVRQKDSGLKATAVDDWGVTAISTRSEKWQHWWPWANGFVPRTHLQGKNGKILTEGCERDEWPPQAFWPGDEYAKANGMVQRIRFIPRGDNNPAGKIFQTFCVKHNAQTVKAKQSWINPKFIKTVAPAKVDAASRGADGTTSK